MNNPILRGFHPDPSIIRVGKDYFLATSTFEWFPGVMIYHSTDLIHWGLIARPLDRPSLLDMKGVPDSCGVWAPCLSHDGSLFHLVYSQVRSFDGVWKDTPNYLTTATDIRGPWSEPIFLGSQGFDGSLFHDQNGSKWYLSMEVDHRKGLFFGGILLQAYDPQTERLTGPVYRIFAGSELGKTEGPHMYQKDGYYYLLTAEGGTEYGHAATIARAREITGPYEISPHGPLITATGVADHPLQKTGHADLVETETGDWYTVFLTGRPLSRLGNCPLGRETAIESLEWPAGDWPRLASGSSLPRLSPPLLADAEEPSPVVEEIHFHQDSLPPTYHSLRISKEDSWISQDKASGCLRLIGRESLSSTFEQSLIARRVQSLSFEYEMELAFQPEAFQQMAGLVAYYNTAHYYYLHVMGEEHGQSRWLQLIRCDNYEMTDLLPKPMLLPDSGNLRLKLLWQGADLQFSYASEGEDWQTLPGTWDAGILSDDHVRDGSDRYRPAFTGAFVGVACQDLSGFRKYAEIHSLIYRELEE